MNDPDDPAYSCQIVPPSPIILKSYPHDVRGTLMWAYVPQPDNSLKRMIIFVADGEPPVQQTIIENFST